jgi:probable rRNA maturation factor
VNDVELASAGIDDPGWLGGCKRFAKLVLDARGIDNWELSILLTNDATIRQLNRHYRDLDAPTDVLSFSQDPDYATPVGEGNIPAGDIVISVETLRRNARARRIPEEEELKRLLIHGILHLEGMDHEDEESGMIRLQEDVLAALNKEKVF